MKKVTFVFLLLSLNISLYSQKVKRWIINDSILGEIIVNKADNKIEKINTRDSIQFFFLVDYSYDNIKVFLGNDVLVDTILINRKDTTENEKKQREADFFLYLPKVIVKNSNKKNICYLINNTKIVFPFKKGYSKIYFSSYSEVMANEKQKRVFSLEYRHDYLGRL